MGVPCFILIFVSYYAPLHKFLEDLAGVVSIILIFNDTIMAIQVKIINQSKHGLPSYATPASAGVDLRANLEVPVVLRPMERAVVPTGLFMEIPVGCEGQVRPRSGLALKSGITVLNSPGTIDADYRGEVKVILVNLSNEEFIINNGDRIAQLVFSRHEQAEWLQVEELENSERGAGGFGSTGRQ